MSKKIGLFLGLLALTYTMVSAPPSNMSEQAWATAGVGMLMVTWWATQVLPIPVTSLIPIVLFPLIGISSVTEAATPYANPLSYSCC